MRPLALPHRLNDDDQRCDHDDCRKVIPVGDAKLITRDSYNMARRFCAANCFVAWSTQHVTKFVAS